MKITIELESFAVRAVMALSLVAWCTWNGQPEVVSTVVALIAALKP